MTKSANHLDVTSDGAAPSHRSSPAVVVACIFSLVVFIGAITLLYRTWLPRQNPSAMIVVQGEEQFVEAEITVEPIDGSSTSLTAKMSPVDDFRLRIHVSPGAYRITFRQNGRVLGVADRVQVTPAEPYFIRLHSPTTRPTTRRLQ